jgi:hypothetical protein
MGAARYVFKRGVEFAHATNIAISHLSHCFEEKAAFLLPESFVGNRYARLFVKTVLTIS